MEALIENYMSDCALCPRNCHVNRAAGQTGYCGQTAVIRAARAALHYWEEPCISGTAGSGAVFFSGCSLGCVYCQNRRIAQGEAGKEIPVGRLSEIFLELQEKGANNVNLVTPGHFAPQIACALRAAKDGGLHIPVVYNTSSYEKEETLRLLSGLVDIYLPDLKYVSAALAKRYSNAPDYFETACAAISEMLRQVGEPLFCAPDGRLLTAEQMNDECERNLASDEEYLMKRGVIVRHLALPGQTEDSRRALEYLRESWGKQIYVSIMSQYTPVLSVPDKTKYPELAVKLPDEEYEALIEYAVSTGIENGFLQEGETASESFIPVFDGEGL